MPGPPAEWWRDAVVYQVYPSSFQDSDGDGIGDLRGVRDRLDHLVDLGVDALWLSPIYPSPFADCGYDVSDYTDVDPRYGTLAELDALVAEAHAKGLRVLLDVVPCHTSIEHPWFRQHPEWYVWSDRDGPANNWLAAFGGIAWSRDEVTGRWYLHSFYPEQPDLDWRRPDVREAVADILRFWTARGVDGFRLDAIDRLLKDPERRDDPRATGPPLLPLHADHGSLEHRHSRNAPDIGTALAALREGAGDAFLVGEVYLPSAELGPYLEHMDVAFGFELFHSAWDAAAVRRAIEAGAALARDGRLAWVLSNHDFDRLPDRVGARNVRAAALLLTALPGMVFVYQGDEIGMANGAEADPPADRAGRDRFRTPMRWSADGGFTAGRPWLPESGEPADGVAEQARDPSSLLALYRDLLRLRRDLAGPLKFRDDVEEGVLAFARGSGHVVALNLAPERRAVPPAVAGAALLRHSHDPGATEVPARLGPGEGLIARRPNTGPPQPGEAARGARPRRTRAR